jgi:hypothetical protein
MDRRVTVGCVLGALVLCSLASVGLAAGGPVSDQPTWTTGFDVTVETDALAPGASVAARQSDDAIELTRELHLTPERPGSYEAVGQYEIPSSVSELTVELRDQDAVVRSDGFAPNGDGTWEWDRSTARPSLTVRVAANQTVDGTGPIATDGEYRFVDVGEWALALTPSLRHTWRSTGASFERTTTVAGEGTAGEAIAFLGPHETYTRTAHGQTITLVVPASATLEEDREAIFSSLLDASDGLRVGDRDEEVFVVAAPTGRIDWGVRGIQTGAADVWVRDSERLDEPDSVWLHEYVHTRQNFDPAPETRWLLEGKATYYATRLAYEQGHISFDAFRSALDRWTRDRYEDVVLADRSTWQGNDGNYPVGALVTGELDRRSRLATDSEASFDRVFARLNGHDGTVTATDVHGFLEAAAGPDVRTAGRRFTTTTERPSPWNETQHGAAFGVTPATFTITFEEDIAVGGPYGNRTLGQKRPLVVVPGERVRTVVRVENRGEVAGDYEAALAVDGRTTSDASGRLGPGESTSLELGHEFTTTGSHTLSMADDAVEVRVREPATPTVTGLGADRTHVEAGETVTLSIDVENAADRPAGGPVTVLSNGRVIDEQSIHLGVSEREALSVTTRPDGPGEYTYRVGEAGDRSVTVVVKSPTATAGERPVNPFALAGGIVLVATGLGGVALWALRRRQSPPTEYDR